MNATPNNTTLKLRHVSSVVVGNALEFYDFLTYAFFAVHISHCFFPSATPGIALLKTLATFGVGFLTRPLGSIVIGRMGDRLGRTPAMMVSFGLMGISMVGLALTPSAAQIGRAAPVLAVMFRLLQGFALGGEVGPSTAFLVEASPLRHRGFVVSLQSASQNLAMLAASMVGLTLTYLFSPAGLDAYGWRIAFLLGAAVVPLGLWMRRSLPETLHRKSAPPRQPPPVRRLVILGSLMLVGSTVQTYVQAYMTTYAITSLHMDEALAFGGSVIGAIVSLLIGPAMAALSDHIRRRRPVLVYPAIARLLLTLPLFWLMIHYHNAPALFIGSALIAGLSAASPTAVVIIEALPQRIRAGAFGITYALAISMFGGTTQFAVQALTDVTHNSLAPAWYLTAAMILWTGAALWFPETAPEEERKEESSFSEEKEAKRL